jgi:DMSO/TMAO reductase YedYZ molybdopterin-dependent catalytic subunit
VAFMNGVLLHSLDGAPLPVNQGGPIRLLIPGDAGPAGPCSNVKAVVRVVFR